MPQIIVTADGGDTFGEAMTLKERVNASDFESQHFATQLVERIGWAVEDAQQVERRQEPVAAEAAGYARPRAVGAGSDEYWREVGGASR